MAEKFQQKKNTTNGRQRRELQQLVVSATKFFVFFRKKLQPLGKTYLELQSANRLPQAEVVCTTDFSCFNFFYSQTKVVPRAR